MKLTVGREVFLKSLQLVSGAVERRQTLPILSNVLLTAQAEKMTLIATDLEVELISHAPVEKMTEEGEITVSARKLMDICRTLPEGSTLNFTTDKDRLILKSQKSRFVLSTLSAKEFPNIEESKIQAHFGVAQNILKKAVENTHFAMAQQDVRYYLNGMLLDLRKGGMKWVATDGHRLAMAVIKEVDVKKGQDLQVIVPRKGMTELTRLLNPEAKEIELKIGTNHVHATTDDFTFISKLIEGKFPDYDRVIPKKGDKVVTVNREELKQALQRASILSNEKYRGVRLFLSSGVLKISATNPEQEEAEEEVAIDYRGAELEIGFNVTYLLDICNAIDTSEIKIIFSDANSSILIENYTDQAEYTYVVMPMRI